MKVERDQIECDLNTFLDRVEANDEDFIDVLDRCVTSEREKTKAIADLISEYAQSKADELAKDEDKLLQYADQISQIGGTPRQQMQYNAEQDIIDRIYENCNGMKGIQNIVGYCAFFKASAMIDDEISQTKYEQLWDFIQSNGNDANLCIADIEKKVEKICSIRQKTRSKQ